MSEANQLRLVASEIICKLHEAGEMTHLELLQAHAQRAINAMKNFDAALEEHRLFEEEYGEEV